MDVLGSTDVLVGFLAALGAAFCFGYAVGHHFADRPSQPPPGPVDPSTEPPVPALPLRRPQPGLHTFRLRRRRS